MVFKSQTRHDPDPAFEITLVAFDEAEAAENLELPGADLSGEELAVRVVPKQVDEFTCSRCFLVHHITQLAKGEGAKAVCKECN